MDPKVGGCIKDRYPCGYCGRGSCQNKLGAPNRKNKELFYNKVDSNCPYYAHVARRVQKASKHNPCTNYLNKCVLCKGDVWLYNIPNHYEDMHPGADASNPESRRSSVDEKEVNMIQLDTVQYIVYQYFSKILGLFKSCLYLLHLKTKFYEILIGF